MGGIDVNNDRAGGQLESGGTINRTPTGQAQTGAGNSAASAAAGTFLADNQDLFGLADVDRLSSVQGSNVEANGLLVQSVVADEGFWVAQNSGASDLVFVYLTSAARSTSGESPFQVQAGQRVNVQGQVANVPADVATLGVDARAPIAASREGVARRAMPVRAPSAFVATVAMLERPRSPFASALTGFRVVLQRGRTEQRVGAGYAAGRLRLGSGIALLAQW